MIHYLLIARFCRDEEGQDLAEYALMGFLIGIAAIMSVMSYAHSVGDAFSYVGHTIASAISSNNTASSGQ